MSLFSKIIKMFYRQDGRIINYQSAKLNWSAMNFSAAADRYMTNPAVFQCVNIVASNMAVVPIKIFNKSREIKASDHDLTQELMNKPNPYQNKVAFFESIAASMMIFGEAFVEIVRDGDGNAIELNPISPSNINTVLNKNFALHKYEYHSENVSRVIDLNNMCHFKNYNPIGHRGISPMQSIMKIIDIYEAAIRHNYRLLENSARPSGALISDEVLSREEKEQLRNDISDIYEGPENAGRIMLLEGKRFKWQEMALSAKDFDYTKAISMACSIIALALGVPTPLLSGITSNQATYSNYKEAKMSLFVNTIIPMMKKIVSELNEKLFVENSLYRLEVDDDYVNDVIM